MVPSLLDLSGKGICPCPLLQGVAVDLLPSRGKYKWPLPFNFRLSYMACYSWADAGRGFRCAFVAGPDLSGLCDCQGRICPGKPAGIRMRSTGANFHRAHSLQPSPESTDWPSSTAGGLHTQNGKCTPVV